MAGSIPIETPPPGLAYIYTTGASSADRNPYSQLVTLDAPTAGNVIAACSGRQGAYFLSKDKSPWGEYVYYTHVLPTPGGSTDRKYATAEKMEYVWRSKKYVMPGRTTWSVAKVVHKCGCVRMRLYIDGCLAYDGVVRDSEPFRLPSQLAGTTLEIELIGSAEVDEVHVASTMKELLANE